MAHSTPEPQSFSQLTQLLAANKDKLDLNAKIALLSMYGNALNNQYNVGALHKTTSLDSLLQSIQTSNGNGGVCRDIHEFLAQSAGALGLQSVGVTQTDWRQPDGGSTPHVVAQFRDPVSKQFLYISYSTVNRTNTRYLTEAVQEQSQTLGPITPGNTVETEVGTTQPGNSPKLKMQEIQNYRSVSVFGALDKASDTQQTRPAVSFSIGTLDSSADARVTHSSIHNAVDGYVMGAATYNDGDPSKMAAVGVRDQVQSTHMINKNISVLSKADGNFGGLVVKDNSPQSQASQTYTGVFGAVSGSSDLNWSTNKNSGSVGVDVRAAEVATFKQVGTDYNIESIHLIDNPSNAIQVHAQSSAFIGTRTAQDLTPVLHPIDNSAGLKFTKSSADGKITLQNDTTVHLLGDVNSGAVGLQDSASLSAQTRRFGTVSTGGDVAGVVNNSNNPYYSVPVTGEVSAALTKDMGTRAKISGSVDYHVNEHKDYLMGGSSLNLPTDPNTLYAPKVSGGVNVTW